VVPFFLTIPNMMFVKIVSKQAITEDGESCFTKHTVQIDDHGLNSDLQFSLTMWLYSILLKLVPCLVLTIFTACLIRAMYQVMSLPAPLLPQAAEHSAQLRGGEEGPGRAARSRNTDKTTRLLIVILLLFLVAEFPQVIVMKDCSDTLSCSKATNSNPTNPEPSTLLI
jgi:hypothetical protein